MQSTKGFPFACVDAEMQTQPSAPHACPILLLIALQSPMMRSGLPDRSKRTTNTTRMHEQNALGHPYKYIEWCNLCVCVCGHMTHTT